jgi:hypothetical protein
MPISRILGMLVISPEHLIGAGQWHGPLKIAETPHGCEECAGYAGNRLFRVGSPHFESAVLPGGMGSIMQCGRHQYSIPYLSRKSDRR